MGKKFKRLCLIVLILLGLCSCGQQVPTWQEQYDLGIRYLSERNYEEAIIAFTAAIEIDPNRALAYVGRGDAYVGCGEAEEHLSAAQADYENAIELDETLETAYLGLANVYINYGEYTTAKEVLQTSLDKLGENQIILDKIAEINNLLYPQFFATVTNVRACSHEFVTSVRDSSGENIGFETMRQSERNQFNLEVEYVWDESSIPNNLKDEIYTAVPVGSYLDSSGERKEYLSKHGLDNEALEDHILHYTEEIQDNEWGRSEKNYPSGEYDITLHINELSKQRIDVLLAVDKEGSILGYLLLPIQTPDFVEEIPLSY